MHCANGGNQSGPTCRKGRHACIAYDEKVEWQRALNRISSLGIAKAAISSRSYNNGIRACIQHPVTVELWRNRRHHGLPKGIVFSSCGACPVVLVGSPTPTTSYRHLEKTIAMCMITVVDIANSVK